MFRKWNMIFLAFMIGLMILNMNFVSVKAQAEPDNFPIGMFLNYDVQIEAGTGPDYSFTLQYQFIEWTDQERLIVYAMLVSHYERVDFTSIRLGCPDHPYLWMDVSTWQLHDFFIINGILHEFTTIENIWISSLGFTECYRLEYELWDENIRTASTLRYHGELGILLHSYHVTEDLIEDLWIDTHNQSLLDSNLAEFNPPTFHQSTTTTSTTPTEATTPTLPTITTTSTTTTTYVIDAYTFLNIILGAGIFIEIALIIAVISSKGNHTRQEKSVR